MNPMITTLGMQGLIEKLVAKMLPTLSFKGKDKQVVFLEAVVEGLDVGGTFWNADEQRMDKWMGGDKYYPIGHPKTMSTGPK